MSRTTIEGTRKAAQIVMALENLEINEIAADPMILIEERDGDVVATIDIHIIREVTAGTATAILSGVDLLGSARRVARMSASMRAEYRRQFNDEALRNPGRSLPIHPDQVDLWAADVPWLEREVRDLSNRRRKVTVPPDELDLHDVSVSYSVDDDGIHLDCPADGWHHVAENMATRREIDALVDAHIRSTQADNS